MCRSCWDQAGQPSEWTDGTAELIELIGVLYQDHVTGGPLHVELDDWNVDGDDRSFRPELWRHVDEQNFGCLSYVAIRICTLLAAMTEEQRLAALAYYEGFIDRPAVGGTEVGGEA